MRVLDADAVARRRVCLGLAQPHITGFTGRHLLNEAASCGAARLVPPLQHLIGAPQLDEEMIVVVT
jgi:hypothetical protein